MVFAQKCDDPCPDVRADPVAPLSVFRIRSMAVANDRGPITGEPVPATFLALGFRWVEAED